ncbi:MAG: N-acetyltransferase family protein [Pseudomonadota bacterium]
MPAVQVRPITPQDAPAVLEIYRQGIATDQATFRRAPPDWAQWDAEHIDNCRFAAIGDDATPSVIGWVALSPMASACYYRGVATVSVYVAQTSKGRGVGRTLLSHVIAAAPAAGFWTLQSNIFPENTASVNLHLACGFRVVGRRERIGSMNGRWRDTLLLELRLDYPEPGD